MFKKMAILAIAGFGSCAFAETYSVTLTNGGLQPISPGVIYTVEGQETNSRIGQAPTRGFVDLCQMGNSASRANELMMSGLAKTQMQTTGPIMPGETRTFDIVVNDPLRHSIQFESMYGKTKDACAVFSVNSHSLMALRQGVTSLVTGTDSAVQTGAFSDPALPTGGSYLDDTICLNITSAVGCLRALSAPVMMGMGRIRYLQPYLSSVNMFLERKYGAVEANSLSVPGAGAIRFSVKLK